MTVLFFVSLKVPQHTTKLDWTGMGLISLEKGRVTSQHGSENLVGRAEAM